MAFEQVVKRQIERLKNPSIKCIDMVFNELSEVVKKSAEGVSNSAWFGDCRGTSSLSLFMQWSLSAVDQKVFSLERCPYFRGVL